MVYEHKTDLIVNMLVLKLHLAVHVVIEDGLTLLRYTQAHNVWRVCLELLIDLLVGQEAASPVIGRRIARLESYLEGCGK